MKYTIEVTKQDIKVGVRGNCFECPVALALTRVFGTGVQVYPEISLPGINPVIRMPDAVRKFVRRFDQKEPVQPFTFEIETP